jgi:O-antigen/teichoic acid export membrane protein
MQGDKAVLGAYLTLAALGVYNIGYYNGKRAGYRSPTRSMPRVLIPLYREANPSECAANARKVRRHLRFLLSGATLILLGMFALGGSRADRFSL